jgi:hypothetical protein
MGGMATSGHTQTTDPAVMLEVIRTGNFDILANTLLTEAPMIQFAYGAVKQAQESCGFQSTPDGSAALAFNYSYFINLFHLGNVDERGRPAPTRDGWILLERQAKHAAQFAYATSFQAKGADLVVDAVKSFGCDNPLLITFVENADAMVALGKAPHVDGEPLTTTLVKFVYSEGDAFAECHYHDGGDSEYTERQDHFVIDPVNWNLMNDPFRVKEIATALGEMPFMRKSCANNLDPDRPWRQGVLLVNPEDSFKIEADGSLTQEMARYFLEVIVMRETGPSLRPDTERRDEILSEITAIEEIVISPAEVTERALELKSRKGSHLPMERFCFAGDNEARRQAFFNEYERAVRLDHLPHSLQEPNYESIVPDGAAYFSVSEIGRGEILSKFGKAWYWDGSACVQDD